MLCGGHRVGVKVRVARYVGGYSKVGGYGLTDVWKEAHK